MKCWLRNKLLFLSKSYRFSTIGGGINIGGIGGIKSEKEKFDGKHYDVAIIGGGSGGLSSAYV